MLTQVAYFFNQMVNKRLELWANCWYKMFIINKVGKYDKKFMGIFIHFKEYVKNWGWGWGGEHSTYQRKQLDLLDVFCYDS